MVVEHVSDGAFAGVRAVSIRSVSEAMQSRHIGILAEVVGEAHSCSAFEVAQEMLESLPVHSTRIGHVLAQLVDDKSDVRASPTGDEVCESNQAAVLLAIGV